MVLLVVQAAVPGCPYYPYYLRPHVPNHPPCSVGEHRRTCLPKTSAGNLAFAVVPVERDELAVVRTSAAQKLADLVRCNQVCYAGLLEP